MSGTCIIVLNLLLSASRQGGTYLSKKMIRLAFSDCTTRFSIQLTAYGFQPTSAGSKYKTPPRDTVAGVACPSVETSKSSRIVGVSEIRSRLAKVNT